MPDAATHPPPMLPPPPRRAHASLRSARPLAAGPARLLGRHGLAVLAGLAALWAAGPAAAVLIGSGDGIGNTTAPSPDPGFGHLGSKNGSLTMIYLGNGWVMTASHVGSGDLRLGGVTYPRVNGSRVDLVHDPVGPVLADVILFRVSGSPELPDLPLLEIADTAPGPGTEVLAIGNGRNRGAPTTWNPPGPGSFDGYEWGTGTAMRWGTNEVSVGAVPVDALGRTSWTFWMDFDAPGSAAATADEFIAAVGDSGGAVFASDGGGTALAGVLILTATYEDQPAATGLYGNATIAVDLSRYRDQIIPLVRPACADEVDNDGDGDVDWPDDASCVSEQWDSEEHGDVDGDGVADDVDNCLVLANTDQCDADLDGYGNLCDADFTQDGAVGIPDYSVLREAYGTLGPVGALVEDLNCDGAVGTPDLNLFRDRFGGSPGPSGLACAGSVPCP